MRLARAALALFVAAGVGATAAGCATVQGAMGQDAPDAAPVKTSKAKKNKRNGNKKKPAPVVAAPADVGAEPAVADPSAPSDPSDPGAAAAEPAAIVDAGPIEEGLASYYADSLAGNRTANGERYKPEAETCAHRTHPFGTRLEITAVASGKTARCRVNDRGPFVKGRVVDVSRRLARELGMIGPGILVVRVRPLPE